MSHHPIAPASLLQSLGGFSEPHYLGLFRAVNRDEIEAMLRGLNATEIHFDGDSALALDAIFAPLDTGEFPRVSVDQVADNTHAIDDLVEESGKSDASPLALAYCASLALFAGTLATAPDICAAERAVRALMSTTDKLGPLWGVELLKFCIWCHAQRDAGSGHLLQAVYVILPFFAVCDLLVSTASTLARMVTAVGGGEGPVEPLAGLTADVRFVQALRQRFEATFGALGTVPQAANEAALALFGTAAPINLGGPENG